MFGELHRFGIQPNHSGAAEARGRQEQEGEEAAELCFETETHRSVPVVRTRPAGHEQVVLIVS